jgi:transcriptional regulator with XRE-family HTH domain
MEITEMDTPSLGNAPFGRNNLRRAVLTASKVQEMRALYGRGHVTQGQLARDYGVSVVQVGRIVRGEVWQGLGPQQAGAEELEASARRLMELQESLAGPSAPVEEAPSGLAKLSMVASKFVTPEMLERKKQLIGGE